MSLYSFQFKDELDRELSTTNKFAHLVKKALTYR